MTSVLLNPDIAVGWKLGERDVCGTADEQEFVSAMMKDLGKYGIRMSRGQNCRGLVTALISHSLLREHGLDTQSLSQFVNGWKSRVFPAALARRMGYRNSLEEFYSDVDDFLEKFNSPHRPLAPADLLEVGLTGANELFSSSRGAQVLKLLAAGTLLSLLFLAAQNSLSSSDEILPPIIVNDDVQENKIEPIVSVNDVDDSSQASGYGMGSKLFGLGALGLIGKGLYDSTGQPDPNVQGLQSVPQTLPSPPPERKFSDERIDSLVRPVPVLIDGKERNFAILRNLKSVVDALTREKYGEARAMTIRAKGKNENEILGTFLPGETQDIRMFQLEQLFRPRNGILRFELVE